MEKQEHKSKWDDLARELGAEITPDIEQREQTRVTTTSELPETAGEQAKERPAKITAPAPQRAADWGKLAGDLGLPAVESEPAAAEQRVEKAAEVARPPVTERPAREPRRQDERRERREPRESRESRPPRERRPESQRKERAPEAAQRERRPAAADRGAERAREDARPVESPPAKPARPVEEPAKPAAVSLWHKIFGAPAEETARTTDTPSRSVDASDDTQEREQRTGAFTGRDRESFFSDDATDVERIREPRRSEDGASTSEESEQGEQTRGRPRRRRRGGRGRKSGERGSDGGRESSRGDEPRRQASEVDEDFEDLRVPESSDGDDEDDHLDDEFSADEDLNGADRDGSQSGRSKMSQRAIPSWDEAIGFIVDTNMQSRTRRPPSRGPSRGNASRGRPRGRRKS